MSRLYEKGQKTTFWKHNKRKNHYLCINQKWLVLFSCLKKSVFYAHFYGRRYRPWLTELWVLLSRLAKIPPNYRLASCIIQSVGKIKNYISSTFHKSRMILKVAIKCYCEKNKGGIIYEKMLVQ